MYESVRFYNQIEVVNTTPVPLISDISYRGPGNVVSGASAWWGLRAYSSNTVRSNAIRLRRDSDNAESDFVTTIDGGLDLTSITTFKGAANLFVTKLYDQTGNGWDLSQATAANQPAFLLATLGTLPVMNFTHATSQWLTNTAGLTIAQIFTSSYVAEVIGSSVDSTVWGKPSGPVALANYLTGGNPNSVDIYAGGSVVDTLTPAPNEAFHAVQIAWHGNTTPVMVDGVTTNVISDIGTGGLITEISLGADTSTGGTKQFNGYIQELGFWSSGFTGTQMTNMNTNQHNYWLF